jgi:hypothetical protein
MKRQDLALILVQQRVLVRHDRNEPGVWLT